MDPLDQDAIARARAMSAPEKLVLAFDLMAAGISLYRAGLRARNPTASEAEIDAALKAWLLHRDEEPAPGQRERPVPVTKTP